MSKKESAGVGSRGVCRGDEVLVGPHLLKRRTGELVEDRTQPTWNCKKCGALANSNQSAVCGMCGQSRPS